MQDQSTANKEKLSVPADPQPLFSDDFRTTRVIPNLPPLLCTPGTPHTGGSVSPGIFTFQGKYYEIQ